MLRLALRSALDRRRRFIATLSAVALSVSFMSGALIFSDTMRATFDDLFSTVNDGTDAVVRSSQTVEGFFQEQRATMDEGVVAQLEGLDGVEGIAASLDNRFALIVGADGETVGQSASGAPTYLFAWTDVEAINPFDLVAGRAPAGPAEVVINQSAADEGGLALGDQVTVIAGDKPTAYELVGVVTFGGQGNAAGSTAAIFDLPTAQGLSGEIGRIDSIAVHGAQGLSQSELRARLMSAVAGQELEVLTGEEYIAEQQEAIAPFLDGFRTFLLVFAGVTLFVGSFIIYNTFTILLTQRTRELALMRAIGAARRQVLTSVLVEAAIVGAVASLVGLVLGLATATMIKGLLAGIGFDLPARGLVLTPLTAVYSVVTGLVVTLGSAMLPAIKAARVPPLAAMRDVSIDSSGRSRIRAVIGAAITGLGGGSLLFGLFVAGDNEGLFVGVGAGATFLGVVILGPVLAVPMCGVLGLPLPRMWGISGTLAVQNATRNPRRTAGTAAALMIGVGLVSLITVFAESVRSTINDEVEEQFRGDLVIDSGGMGFGGLPPALARELDELDAVAYAAPIRFALVGIDGSGQLALGIDPTTLSAIFDLAVAEGSLSDLAPGQVAVSLESMKFHGWEMGDTIELTFPETGAQQFTIAAITGDSVLGGGNEGGIEYTLHNADLDANIPQPFDVLVYIELAEGVSTEAGLAAVQVVADEYPNASVLDIDGYKESQTSWIDQLLSLITGLLLLAIIVALIGIANTLSLSIVERTREIGLLRAVGMTRTQLRRTVRGEAIVMAVFGTVLGLGIGVFFGVSLVTSLSDDGLVLTVPVGQLAVIGVLGALAGVLSSVIPARRVSRLDVLASIGAE